MKVNAEPRNLEGPLVGGQQGAFVTVEPMVCGTMQAPPVYLESPDGELGAFKLIRATRKETLPVPIVAFLIRHPKAGPLLVDTGLHASVASDASQNFGRVGPRITQPHLDPGRDVPAQLRDKGVDPGTVRTVILTHLHTDHASGIAQFPEATFVVTREEWHEAATASPSFTRGYHRPQFDYAFDYRTVDFSTDRVVSYSTFARTIDLFGDGSVRLAFTPGHSAGHMSVIARLESRDLVIGGDVCHLARQLEPGADLPARTFDRHNFKRSLQEARLFHREYPDAVITPGHDSEFYASAPDVWR